MADTTTCPRCQGRNDAGAAFCSACGASLAPQAHCPSCNALNPLGDRFCTRCGGSLEHAGWAGAGQASPGAVVDGVWERGGDELIRRVDPEDARRYLGARTVRVPAGTAGVVLVDGVVDRVLPPGERTTLGLFERVADFFLRRRRTAFYLVDQRPFPVPFVVRSRPSSSGHAVKTQVLVTFTLPRGDKAALALFIANVLGDRPTFTGGDLYDLLRPDVVRVAQETIDRAMSAEGEISYPDAEAAIRVALAGMFGPRYGLTADATLAPLTAIASLSFHLGAGAAPRVRPCVSCRHELPASLRFCDACGAKQPTVMTGGEPASAETPLFSADGQQVELDLIVRVQGQHDDFAPDRIAPALVGAAAAHLREAAFAALAGPGGFAALEQAMSAAAVGALETFGLTLVALSVVDARTKTGEWLLSARADLERAKEDLRLGRAWLEQRDEEIDLEEITLTQRLRAQKLRRDDAFARDAAAVEDRERREDLAAREAAMAAAAAAREGATRAAKDAVEHDRQRREIAHANEMKRQRVQAELDELRARRDLDFEEAARREGLQLEKMRALAEIDRQIAEAEREHELEKRRMMRGLTPEEMIALQAAELARTEGGGAAWANALAQKAGAEAERRHAEDLRGVYQSAMDAMSDVARSRAEAAPVAPPGAAPVVTIANAAGPEPGSAPCASCGAPLKPAARFCGACGKPRE